MLGPILLLNTLVAFCGRTVVFPLSLRHLGDKTRALGRYALHRPHCLVQDHPSVGPIVARIEARYRIPAGLLAALVQVESDGRPHRISPAGAMGPGQLAPSTARLLNIVDPFDTEENIEGSGRYLAQQLARFGDVRLALAAYNAGPGAVVAARAVPRNGETEIYVERVLRLHRAATPPPRPLIAAAPAQARAPAPPGVRSSSPTAAPELPPAPPASPGAPTAPEEAPTAPEEARNGRIDSTSSPAEKAAAADHAERHAKRRVKKHAARPARAHAAKPARRAAEKPAAAPPDSATSPATST